MSRHPFAAILRVRGVALLLGLSGLARLPAATSPLAVVLFVADRTGSFGAAGLVVGAQVLGAALTNPVKGRAMDRLGQRALLVPLAVVHAGALAGLIAAGLSDRPLAALAAVALLAGLAFPPTGVALYVLWPRLLRDSPALVGKAYALDTIVFETTYILGPLLAGLLVLALSPAAAVAVAAAVFVVGTLSFVAAAGALGKRPAPRAPSAAIDRWGALRSPGVRAIALGTLPLGFCVSSTDVALSAFASARGAPGLAGLLIASYGAGSVAGAVLYGTRARAAGSLVRWQTALTAGLAVGALALALAPSPLAMVPLALVASMPFGPLVAVRSELIASLAPAGTVTEAFLWPHTALLVGMSLGSAASGFVAQVAGWRAAVLAGAAGMALGAAWTLARRSAFAPVPAPAGR